MRTKCIGVIAMLAVVCASQAMAMYNPQTGRFLSRDPRGELGFQVMQSAGIGMQGSSLPHADAGRLFNRQVATVAQNRGRIFQRAGLLVSGDDSNPYAFVGNSPVSHWDPLGLLVGTIDVPIFQESQRSTLGFKFRGWLFQAIWKPPTGGAWDGPCECKPCQKVVWLQEAGWLVRRTTWDTVEPWHLEWTADEAGDYGAVWECEGSATVNDEPGFSTFYLSTHQRWLFQSKTYAKCVEGEDAGTVYGTVRWGAGWLPPDDLSGYGPVIY